MNIPHNPLDLFRRGFDTLQIAQALVIPEAQVLKQIHNLRTAEKRSAYRRAKAKGYRLADAGGYYRRRRDELRSIRASFV